MTYTKRQGKTLSLNRQHPSDGSELIPAEVQATIRHNDVQAIETPVITSYTIDDEGLVNIYAIEPEIYPAVYPSYSQQRRYILLGSGAALLVAILVLISFSVS